ncbi:MAG: preprotein translocase subunit SecA [Deltaproteobacteria bacterium]|nr:MAG: preprotein translocase subunit SecA [Deltaproteobacteria bacterium]
MFGGLTKIINKNERELRKFASIVKIINELEPRMQKLSDLELKDKTTEFKDRFKEGETLDDLLPEAFAVVREAAVRTIGQRHFDVQLMGGIVLHQGKIAEMKTGEGKTLAATLPVYLNALTGEGVHVVTVNDYLARRDRHWMGEIYEFLGLSVGVIQHDMDDKERQQAYNCDITYGTNSEFGFDYLRDNHKQDLKNYVQREFHYAIVDEVDSILIDEARTPLIISGEVEKDTHSYHEFKGPIETLVRKQKSIVDKLFNEAKEYDREDPDSYEKYFKLLQVEKGDPKNKRLLNLISEKKETKKQMERVEDNLRINKSLKNLEEGLLYAKSERENIIELTEDGQNELVRLIKEDIYDTPELSVKEQEIEEDESLSPSEKEQAKRKLYEELEEKNRKQHNINQLLRAYTLFEKDTEYVIHNNEVVIVDEFTGRMMPGRRYSEGLHQAIEAKEGVRIAKASQTVATITLQNYFRMYRKLAGMTGTAYTEAPEFDKTYGLKVVVIPTNEPMVRNDYPDIIYKTEDQKFKAVVEEIKRIHDTGQPILVGTVSVDKSERLSRTLKRTGVKHEVLNAKHHEREAEIVAQAGRKGALTISTNMAGRGTDIILGGNPEMLSKVKIKQDTPPEEAEKIMKTLRDQCTREREEVLKSGGLHILGTERHEARRIDDQLRGRSGRQGDPGSSRFLLSLEDDLMRIFGSDRISSLMDRMGIEENDAIIEHKLVTRAIDNAQKKVVERNFNIRKRLLEFDDVNNEQRKTIYRLRRDFLSGENLRERLFESVDYFIDDLLEVCAPADRRPEEWDYGRIERELTQFSVFNPLKDVDREELREILLKCFEDEYEAKSKEIAAITGEEDYWDRHIVKGVMLQIIDRNWMEVLDAMDDLKEGVHLRGYGQRDPLREYQKEGFEIFSEMMARINDEFVRSIFAFRLRRAEEDRKVVRAVRARSGQDIGQMLPQPESADLVANTPEPEVKRTPVRREGPKVGRNDPCPCGSGKKYKKCCLVANEATARPG